MGHSKSAIWYFATGLRFRRELAERVGMRTIAVLILGLACGCAQSGSDTVEPSPSSGEAKSITMTVESCIEMALHPMNSYSIHAPIENKFFILTSGTVYKWDLATGVTERVQDDNLEIDQICALDVRAGIVLTIGLVQTSAPSVPLCGGRFQPTCPPPPTPTCPPWACF